MKRKLITAISIGFIAIISILILTGAALKIRGANDIIPTSSACEVVIHKLEDGKDVSAWAYYYDSEAVAFLTDVFRGKYVTDIHTETSLETDTGLTNPTGTRYFICVYTPDNFGEGGDNSQFVQIYIDAKSGEYKIYVANGSPAWGDDIKTYYNVKGINLDVDKIDRYFKENSPKNVTAQDGEFYGTVKYISDGNPNLSVPRHFLYVAPFGDRSGLWIPFVVSGSTSAVKVGDSVKITYSGTSMDGTLRRDGYFAETVEITDANRGWLQTDPLWLKGVKYKFNREDAVMTHDFGTVVHVVRIRFTKFAGYIVYLYDTNDDIGNLTCYWVDDRAIFSDEAKLLFLEGKTGYRLDILGVVEGPYDNLDIKAAVSVSAELPSESNISATVGDIIKSSDVQEISFTWDLFSAYQPMPSYDGISKDMIFSILLKNKKITNDKERVQYVKSNLPIANGEPFARNVAHVRLDVSEDEYLLVQVNKYSGEFILSFYKTVEGVSTVKTYASAEGESINVELLKLISN